MIQPLHAGVANPNISAIGQLSGAYTENPASVSSKQPTLELGEMELVLDAALNPYFNGAFVLSVAPDGVEIEEVYTSIPHAYPFIRTPRVMDPSIARP
ncbi:MAG: hypothetical protein A2293_04005 [Elusimicrobia bacterium RIFOXYB2_FULL_49_7]|nr:MAG: hypothetical protein A2293_04005 [Elusimicrobia bacterium RIFOXYB2_FULL_49_7]